MNADDVREYRNVGFICVAPARWVAVDDMRFLLTTNNLDIVEMAKDVQMIVRDQVGRGVAELVWIWRDEQESETRGTRSMRDNLPCCEYHYGTYADMGTDGGDMP